MKFRRNAPVAIVLAIAIVIAVLTFLSIRLFAGMTDAVEANQFRVMRGIVEASLNDSANKALARAELIADLPSVKKLFAAGDRDGLLAELKTVYANQRARYMASQAQFHVPPAKSFLRLNDPKKFGDDLTAFRPMVVAAIRKKAPMKGMTVARSGPGIFGIIPVNDETGKFIGTFEIGIDVGPVLSNLKAAYGFDLAFFIEERILRQYAKGVKPERLGEQNRVGKYIRFETTNSQMMKILANADDLAVVNEPTTYVRVVNGRTRGVVLIPVNNTAGTQLGVIAVSQDFSASRAAASRTLIAQIVLALGAVLILAGFVVVVLRGFLLRPLQVLTDRFDALHTGEPLQEIPGASRFPEELQPFVQVFEKIRARRRRETGAER
jgi:methyl-accepting chemotaxis protein